jgi:hypothetical protein
MGSLFKKDRVMKSKKKQFNTSDEFIKFTPSGNDICVAHERAKKMGVLPNSYTQGLGRMAGCLGEIAVNKYLPRSKYVGDTSFCHDITYKNKEIEVKSKTCSSQPKLEYGAFVNCKNNPVLNNDVYFFTRVRRDLMLVWLVGWLPTTTLLKKADFVKRGDCDEDGYTFKSSGLHIPIKKLKSPGTFM